MNSSEAVVPPTTEYGFFDFRKKYETYSLDQKLYASKKTALHQKHHTGSKLSLLRYSDLDYKDLYQLKYWKENNFVIALDLKDLFLLSDRKFLELVVKKRVPLLLKTPEPYLAKGLIKLNLAILLLERKIPCFSSIIELNKRACVFLGLKTLFLDLRMKEYLNQNPLIFSKLYPTPKA